MKRITNGVGVRKGRRERFVRSRRHEGKKIPCCGILIYGKKQFSKINAQAGIRKVKLPL